MKCEGPFIVITIENKKIEMRKSTASGREKRDRQVLLDQQQQRREE